MAAGDLFDPGGVVSVDLGGAAAGQGTAASVGPEGTAAAVAANPAGAAVMAVWLHLEVPVGSLEQGDRNSHIGSPCCWPGDIPLYDVLLSHKRCIWWVLAVGPLTAMVGNAAGESGSCSSFC